MGRNGRQRRARRRRRNADLKCRWCGCPAKPYGGFDGELNAAMIRGVPGSPEGSRLPVHVDCIEGLQMAVTSDDKGWQERVRLVYVQDGTI